MNTRSTLAYRLSIKLLLIKAKICILKKENYQHSFQEKIQVWNYEVIAILEDRTSM